MQLTRKERWNLSNQYKLLELLDKENADYYQECQEVINCGYEFDYGRLIPFIYEETMSHDNCLEVLDILDMFSQIQFANNKLPGKDKVQDGFVEFPGFDGNNETKQLAYTHLVCEMRDGFANLRKGDHYNSHAPLLSIYREMLNEWNKSSNKYELTEKDIIRITSVKSPGK